MRRLMPTEELGGEPGNVVDVLAGVPLIASSERLDCLGNTTTALAVRASCPKPDRRAWRSAVERVPCRLMITAETGAPGGGPATR